jgi:hypothetical protein
MFTYRREFSCYFHAKETLRNAPSRKQGLEILDRMLITELLAGGNHV